MFPLHDKTFVNRFNNVQNYLIYHIIVAPSLFLKDHSLKTIPLVLPDFRCMDSKILLTCPFRRGHLLGHFFSFQKGWFCKRGITVLTIYDLGNYYLYFFLVGWNIWESVPLVCFCNVSRISPEFSSLYSWKCLIT